MGKMKIKSQISCDVADVIALLLNERDEVKAKSLAHFGIEAKHILGIRLPQLRSLAKVIGKNQGLAEALWLEKYHEAKLLATLIANPKTFPLETADVWVKDLYSWDVCDQFCSNVLWRTDYAWGLPERWAKNDSEFIRRAGLVMIAQLVVHQKNAEDDQFRIVLPLLKTHAFDDRNFVKKAVNWSLREVGKRRPNLLNEVVNICESLQETDNKAASWIAADALREFRNKGLLPDST